MSTPSRRGKPRPTARYPLRVLVPLIPRARVAKGKATQSVKDRLAQVRRMSDAEAEDYVRQLVRTLTEDAFVRTDELTWHEGIFADVYGAQDAHGDWYIKLYVVDELAIVSCHEPQGTMRRADGKTVGRPRR